MNQSNAERFIELEIVIDIEEIQQTTMLLKIPCAVIDDVASPTAKLKYLTFVGGCVLGVPGRLLDHNGQPVLLTRSILPDDRRFRFEAPSGACCSP